MLEDNSRGRRGFSRPPLHPNTNCKNYLLNVVNALAHMYIYIYASENLGFCCFKEIWPHAPFYIFVHTCTVCKVLKVHVGAKNMNIQKSNY